MLQWVTMNVLCQARNTPSRRRRTSGDESRLRGRLTSAASGSKVARPFCACVRRNAFPYQQVAVVSCTGSPAEQPIRMIRWPDWPMSSDADSTCRISRKKADEDQLQPTSENLVGRRTKTALLADCRLGVCRASGNRSQWACVSL